VEIDIENKRDNLSRIWHPHCSIPTSSSTVTTGTPDMRKTMNVLSLGIEEWRLAVRKALPTGRKSGFGGVNNLWDLCALPEAVSVDVAVFHNSFSRRELRCAAEYIRRRWPEAVILVIGERAKQLDDPLYDHKANCEISVEDLARMIETLVAGKAGIRRNVRSGLSNVRG
jgi:hypothetical protein